VDPFLFEKGIGYMNQNKVITSEEKDQQENDQIKDMGQITLNEGEDEHQIHLLTIIGEIEGHDCLSNNTKATKYEHVLPKLASIEDDKNIDGVLVLINTVGGDVESGLAIAEMIASLSKPTVSLVLGGSHSIGVPLAVSTNYSYIVPTGTMVIHPVRLTGLVIGAPQTYDYFQQMQDRIIGFVSDHCFAKKSRLEEMMLNTGMLTKDLGTILVGKQAVSEGIINEVGGIDEAIKRLHKMIDENQKCTEKQ
jgi:ATP-dependent protease ClpP protease subunit